MVPLKIAQAFDTFSETIADQLRPGTQIVIAIQQSFEDLPSGSAMRIVIGDGVLATVTRSKE